MSITNENELTGMQQVSEAVAYTLKKMQAYARVGMSTKELDNYGANILKVLAPNRHHSLLIIFRDIPALV